VSLLVWFFLLIFQSAAFTWVSRARNSGSLGYHAIASVFSNGIYFYTNIFLIALVANFWTDARQSEWTLVIYAAIYISGTVTGAVLMHYVSLRWLESGKRKVGG
jgi:hypothetical protein